MGAARLEKQQRVGEGGRKKKGGKEKTAKGKGLAEKKRKKKRDGTRGRRTKRKLVLAGRESPCRCAPHVFHLPLFSYPS